METKRFIGSDLRRLYDRIRRELGPDAMVIHTRSLMREGASPLTEILAAAPEGTAGLSLESQQTVLHALLARLEAEPRPLTVGDLEDLAARDALHQADSPPPLPEPGPVPGIEPEWLTGLLPGAPGRPDGILARAREQLSQLPDEPPPAFEWQVRPPIEVTPRARLSREERPARTESARSMFDSLIAAGLSPAAARVVLETAPGESNSYRALAATLERRAVRYPEEGQTALITIQGPVGAGKTTALVRMALDCIDAGREALLVAADTAHVGARAQVHAYAEATGLPVDDAFDQREVARSVARARRGACGVRFNAVSGNGTPLDRLDALARRIAPLGWHLQLYTHGDTLAELAPRLPSLPVEVVIDHMGGVRTADGVNGAAFQALLRLLGTGRAWVKLSGYRISSAGQPYADVAPFARALLEAAPERCVWGTDWPHPSLADFMPDDGALFDRLGEWAPDAATRRRVLVDNPAALYGFPKAALSAAAADGCAGSADS